MLVHHFICLVISNIIKILINKYQDIAKLYPPLSFRDYGRTDRRTDGPKDGQSDPYVPPSFNPKAFWLSWDFFREMANYLRWSSQYEQLTKYRKHFAPKIECCPFYRNIHLGTPKYILLNDKVLFLYLQVRLEYTSITGSMMNQDVCVN